jgi:hypothetical protein
MLDLKLHRRQHRQADADQTLAGEQAESLASRGGGRHIGRGAGSAVDQPEQRVGRISGEPRLRVLRAERPAVLRLVTGEAGPAVAPEILEERVSRGLSRAVRLIARDHAARIGVDLELRDGLRGRLRADGALRKQHAHFLFVRNFAGDRRRGGRVVIGPHRSDRSGEQRRRYHSRTAESCDQPRQPLSNLPAVHRTAPPLRLWLVTYPRQVSSNTKALCPRPNRGNRFYAKF